MWRGILVTFGVGAIALLGQTSAQMADAKGCQVDPNFLQSSPTWEVQYVGPLGEGLAGRTVRNALLTLRLKDNTIGTPVGIYWPNASAMRVYLLGSEVVQDPDVYQVLVCLVRGWKQECGGACVAELHPVPVQIISGPGYEALRPLAVTFFWGLLGLERSRADVRLPGGESSTGVLLVQSQAGDLLFFGQLFGGKRPGSAQGYKGPGIALALRQILHWEELLKQAIPFVP
jgi:hypothetical protein